MSEAISVDEARATLGNYPDNGPPRYAEDAVDQLKKRLLPLTGRRAEFIDKISKVKTIRNREDAGAAADVIGMARDVEKIVDREKKAVADPHSDAVGALSNYATKFWEPVVLEIQRLRGLVDDFAREERRRATEQEEEQRRVEKELRRDREAAGAQLPAATAPAPAKKRSYRGDYGRQAIVVDDYEVEIVDARALPDFIFQTDKVKEAIIAVAKTFRKTGIEEIAGLKFTTDVKTQIRK